MILYLDISIEPIIYKDLLYRFTQILDVLEHHQYRYYHYYYLDYNLQQLLLLNTKIFWNNILVFIYG